MKPKSIEHAIPHPLKALRHRPIIAAIREASLKITRDRAIRRINNGVTQRVITRR
jgi:hypothetical protein